MPIQLVLEQPNLRKGESNFCVIHGLALAAQGSRAHECLSCTGCGCFGICHRKVTAGLGLGGITLDYQGGGIVVSLVLSALERLFQASLVLVAEHLLTSRWCW